MQISFIELKRGGGILKLEGHITTAALDRMGIEAYNYKLHPIPVGDAFPLLLP